MMSTFIDDAFLSIDAVRKAIHPVDGRFAQGQGTNFRDQIASVPRAMYVKVHATLGG